MLSIPSLIVIGFRDLPIRHLPGTYRAVANGIVRCYANGCNVNAAGEVGWFEIKATNNRGKERWILRAGDSQW